MKLKNVIVREVVEKSGVYFFSIISKQIYVNVFATDMQFPHLTV